MGNPKKKVSKSQRDKRRSHDALCAPATIACPQCGELTRPHCACSACGYYKGKQVILTAADS